MLTRRMYYIIDAPGSGKLEESMSIDDVEERGEEGVEIAALPLIGDIARFFRILTKSFVSHFAAKRALERHAVKKLSRGIDVRIHILGSHRSPIESGSWDDIKMLVHELAAADPWASKLAEGQINKLVGHIAAFDAAAPLDKKKYHKVYRQFSRLRKGNETGQRWLSLFIGCRHCEALIAAASKYHDRLSTGPQEDQILRQVIQVCCQTPIDGSVDALDRDSTQTESLCHDSVVLSAGT